MQHLLLNAFVAATPPSCVVVYMGDHLIRLSWRPQQQTSPHKLWGNTADAEEERRDEGREQWRGRDLNFIPISDSPVNVHLTDMIHSVIA